MAVITIHKLVKALKTVPEKTFRIMDLAPQLIDAKGLIDVEKCLDRQPDINLAITEIQAYIRDCRVLADAVGGAKGRAADCAEASLEEDEE